ncbi:MAG: AraC family transcriptional regulator [Saccharofermentans sp.]|nr:AraC family transcriptional regulator [Saccharofermentans sp.]
MEANKNSTFKKVLAAVTAASLLSFILLAGIFIILEAGHDCEGEDCPVCECIEQCQATLHQLSAAIKTQGAVLLVFPVLITGSIHLTGVFNKENPVSDKVRLNI